MLVADGGAAAENLNGMKASKAKLNSYAMRRRNLAHLDPLSVWSAMS